VQVLLAVQAVAIAKILGQAAAAAHVVPLLTRLVQEDGRISLLENFSELVAVAGVRHDSRRPPAACEHRRCRPGRNRPRPARG
jgi:hypothetical protein